MTKTRGKADPQRIDLTNKRFGLLYVKRFAEVRDKRAFWLCLCDCGGTKIVSGKNLRSGQTKSCGCRARTWTHGLHKHRFYYTYRGMMKRCYDTNHVGYPRYGGRGISVCKAWRTSIKRFLDWCESKGPIPENYTLDRENNDGDYSPNNCRFVSKSVQQSNQRRQKK